MHSAGGAARQIATFNVSLEVSLVHRFRGKTYEKGHEGSSVVGRRHVLRMRWMGNHLHTVGMDP
jgi:hypothetical protein